ncbi:MAG: hypothetical protein ACJA0N_000383 [Pseudohongiellaceae bacterium]|jgi:hypothetical protein
MDRVIDEIRANNMPVPVPLELPTMDDIIDVEEEILLSLDNEFRQFLLTVSDVVLGSLEPVTVVDPNSHTYLPEVAALAWSLGLPREYIPLCEDRGNYYCTDEAGEVQFWENGELSKEQPWGNVWEWAEHVWLNP